MHELTIMEDIRDAAIKHAADAGASRITDLHLVIGDLASVQEESVRLYWDLLSRESPAAGASLHVRRVPAVLECRPCGQQFSPLGIDLKCPHCGGGQVTVISGKEIYLEAIDIETNGDARQKAV